MSQQGFFVPNCISIIVLVGHFYLPEYIIVLYLVPTLPGHRYIHQNKKLFYGSHNTEALAMGIQLKRHFCLEHAAIRGLIHTYCEWEGGRNGGRDKRNVMCPGNGPPPGIHHRKSVS